MNEANEQARLVARKIIKRLSADIGDRRGLGDEWEQIDSKVMEEELVPAWTKIIAEEVAKASGQQPEAVQNARTIAGSVSANGSVDTWKLHILGPDDLLPMESELHALREANMLNIGMARVRQKRPNDPNMPWCMAVVERNGVEYTSDQYPLNAGTQRRRDENAPLATDAQSRRSLE